MKNKNIFLFILLGLIFPIISFATDPATVWFESILDNFLRLILWPIFAAVVIIMFIYAGFMYLTANGEPGKIHAAHRAVIYAIVGIIVAVVGYGAVNLVKGLIPTVPGSVQAGDSCTADADCATGSCGSVIIGICDN